MTDEGDTLAAAPCRELLSRELLRYENGVGIFDAVNA